MSESINFRTSSEVESNLRAYNILLNLTGLIIPVIVGVTTIPFIVQGMGIENFGLLSLAWMILGYFTIFDLGLGRATTKFLSEEIKKGLTVELRDVFWTSCWMNFFLGFFGGLIIYSMASLLAESVFKISPDLIDEAKKIFIILAMSCPIVLVSLAFKGALEAAQKFTYINIVVIITSSLSFIVPVLGIILGLAVYKIVLLLMITRLCSALIYLFFCFRVFPILRRDCRLKLSKVRDLSKFGLWVSISNVVNPVLLYFDRFLIGTLISVAAVAYYTAPYEMVTRLSILPVSFAMTLFPSFSAMNVSTIKNHTGLYSRSIKMLLVFICPLIALVFLFATDILSLWLGAQFAINSSMVLRILTIGVLLNSLAQIPFAMIQGFGHPDITAKFHLIELILYVPIALILVNKMGVVGGALSWTIRVTVDAILLFVASTKYINLREFLNPELKRCIYMAFSMLCILIGGSFIFDSFSGRTFLSIGVMVAYTVILWRQILNSKEKETICFLLCRIFRVSRNI